MNLQNTVEGNEMYLLDEDSFYLLILVLVILLIGVLIYCFVTGTPLKEASKYTYSINLSLIALCQHA